MTGSLSAAEIESLLQQQFIGRIGCHADGKTYVVPISYAYDGLAIYSLAGEGQKIDMMRKNPAVCFQVDNTNSLDNWQSVVAWGDFEELQDPADRNAALQLLNNRKLPQVISERMQLTNQWPFIPDNFDNIKGIVFRIRLTSKTGRFEKSAEGTYYAS